jgi:hypothetical protein
MKMSVDDFKTVLSEFRSSEEKKNLYILIGVLIAVVAVAVGVAALLIKKNSDEIEDWDDDEDYFDDDFECDDDCACEEDTQE